MASTCLSGASYRKRNSNCRSRRDDVEASMGQGTLRDPAGLAAGAVHAAA
jgi:hypothetical protein